MRDLREANKGSGLRLARAGAVARARTTAYAT